MVWEAVFMLVLLKIPIVYLCMVVWWAIRAEPRDQELESAVPVSDTPTAPPGWSRPTKPGRRPGPDRTARGRVPQRPSASARGEARR